MDCKRKFYSCSTIYFHYRLVTTNYTHNLSFNQFSGLIVQRFTVFHQCVLYRIWQKRHKQKRVRLMMWRHGQKIISFRHIFRERALIWSSDPVRAGSPCRAFPTFPREMHAPVNIAARLRKICLMKGSIFPSLHVIKRPRCCIYVFCVVLFTRLGFFMVSYIG